MKMKKTLYFLLSVLICLSMAACGKTAVSAPETPSSLESETVTETTIGEHEHIYGAWETSRAPECEFLGKRQAYCTVCGKKISAYLPALGHDFENGFCTRCGKAYFSQNLRYVYKYDGYAVSGRGETEDLEIVIPSFFVTFQVTSIRCDAFYGAADLTAVHMPEGIEEIGAYAFYKCRGLKNMDLPAGLQYIDDGAFFGCTGLESVTFPEGLFSIDVEAFGECFRLQNAAIPDSVEFILEGAFFNCISLEKITIGKGVKTIGKGAFEGCDGLVDVYYTGTEEDWAKIKIAEGNEFLTEAKIHFGEG